MSEKTRLKSRKLFYSSISVEISVCTLLATLTALVATTTFFNNALFTNKIAITTKTFGLLRYSHKLASSEPTKSFIIHAHRGGAGMRAESTIYAFAYGIDVGADAIELDVLFTKDGIPVIWHDFTIDADKCTETVPGSGYLGKYINELTVAEIKTLECGSQQSENHIQAQTFPGAQIHTLPEVLTFISCYSPSSYSPDINLETKLDPRLPNQTLPLSHYLYHLVPILASHNFVHRTIIQTFDWRTLAIKSLFPHLPLRFTANIDETMLEWNLEHFGNGTGGGEGGIGNGGNGLGDRDWIEAAKRLGADAVSPIHGSPGGLGDWTWTVNTKGYIPMTTGEVVRRAHGMGMKVFPWTVDDESTIEKLIDEGVDGLISNYPMRVAFMVDAMGLKHNLKKEWRPAGERRAKFEECAMKIAGMPPMPMSEMENAIPDVSPQAHA